MFFWLVASLEWSNIRFGRRIPEVAPKSKKSSRGLLGLSAVAAVFGLSRGFPVFCFLGLHPGFSIREAKKGNPASFAIARLNSPFDFGVFW